MRCRCSLRAGPGPPATCVVREGCGVLVSAAKAANQNFVSIRLPRLANVTYLELRSRQLQIVPFLETSSILPVCERPTFHPAVTHQPAYHSNDLHTLRRTGALRQSLPQCLHSKTQAQNPTSTPRNKPRSLRPRKRLTTTRACHGQSLATNTFSRKKMARNGRTTPSFIDGSHR